MVYIYMHVITYHVLWKTIKIIFHFFLAESRHKLDLIDTQERDVFDADTDAYRQQTGKQFIFVISQIFSQQSIFIQQTTKRDVQQIYFLIQNTHIAIYSIYYRLDHV